MAILRFHDVVTILRSRIDLEQIWCSYVTGIGEACRNSNRLPRTGPIRITGHRSGPGLPPAALARQICGGRGLLRFAVVAVTIALIVRLPRRFPSVMRV